MGGFDLTFSAPKSVSVVFALAGEDVARHVVAAHRESVRGALAYVEAHGLSAQRGSGEERHVVPTTGLVAASFTHGVNRNLDPHLHTHVVMANMVHGADSRWSACDHRGLSAHRGATSAIYEAHLRGELTARLGVRWVDEPRLGAEVAGVSLLVRGEFSSRSADIRRHMRRAGIALGPGRPGRVGGHPARRSSQRSTSPRCRRNGSDAPTSSEVMPMSCAPSSVELTAARASRVSTSIDSAPPCRWLPTARHAARDVAAAFGAAALAGAPAQSVERLTDLWTPKLSARTQIGVAEDVHTLRSVVPGAHLLGALGPRPVNPADHAVWRDAATVIDEYRARWGVPRGSDALGTDDRASGISSLPTARLVDHLRDDAAY